MQENAALASLLQSASNGGNAASGAALRVSSGLKRDPADGLAERGGFEPPRPFRGLHALQACAINQAQPPLRNNKVCHPNCASRQWSRTAPGWRFLDGPQTYAAVAQNTPKKTNQLGITGKKPSRLCQLRAGPAFRPLAKPRERTRRKQNPGKAVSMPAAQASFCKVASS